MRRVPAHDNWQAQLSRLVTQLGVAYATSCCWRAGIGIRQVHRHRKTLLADATGCDTAQRQAALIAPAEINRTWSMPLPCCASGSSAHRRSWTTLAAPGRRGEGFNRSTTGKSQRAAMFSAPGKGLERRGLRECQDWHEPENASEEQAEDNVNARTQPSNACILHPSRGSHGGCRLATRMLTELSPLSPAGLQRQAVDRAEMTARGMARRLGGGVVTHGERRQHATSHQQRRAHQDGDAEAGGKGVRALVIVT